ncbi:MAG: hypothetical protein M1838_004870 [Thelocarpon superellum]|nr:MAG: hypothetical protein M1838_004870 [Thelocarpon superellum]
MRGLLRRSLVLLATVSAPVLATDVLQTTGFNTCLQGAEIQVNQLDVEYSRVNNTVSFDVAGSSAAVHNVTASLTVTAYGNQVYQKDFDPCDPNTKVDQLCPVPAGNFGAHGSQNIPPNYADMIPSIAFQIPDLDGQAKLELKSTDGGQSLACIESDVSNGKTIEIPAISYIAAGISVSALVMSGVSAFSAAGVTGAGAPSPGFGTTFGWFSSMAMNGMLSVNYPPLYRSFSKNFAFSGGLVSWTQLQSSIDSFRNNTGGNLTANSVAYLQNATLVFQGDDGGNSTTPSVSRRAIHRLLHSTTVIARDVSTSVNGSQSGAPGASGNSSNSKPLQVVHGIQGYVEQLEIPQANTFMTVLLIFAIVVAAVTAGILLFKLILEVWALFGSFPKRLTGFRKRYWGLLARTIVNLILLLYGLWSLYCVYELTHGDSWAAKLLAGVSLAIFTGVLGFFIFRIWQLARRYKQTEGDPSGLYEDKETWRKYSLFYDQYKKNLWWIFIPTIVYMFARGCVIAAGDGHGFFQSGGQLIVEALMLGLLIWCRPYATKSGNWINIVIQVVRALSVVCILVFVEELGISQTTKTITGLVLIVVQSVLTGLLAILITVNAIVICCRENPHRKKRKEAEKLSRDLDDLTPLDARNSLLIDPGTYADGKPKGPLVSEHLTSQSLSPSSPPRRTKTPMGYRRESSEDLVSSAAAMGHHRDLSSDSVSIYSSVPPLRPGTSRGPTVPNVGGYRGMAY